MGQLGYTTDEIVARGKDIYEQQLRDKLEAQNVGKFLVIDIETGDYEMDEDDLIASKRASQKNRVRLVTDCALVSQRRERLAMSLLKGFRITIDAIDGGEVRIELRP